MALLVQNYLANGMGGLDWSGFDLIVEKLGIEDVEGLLDRLLVIKTHRPKENPQ